MIVCSMRVVRMNIAWQQRHGSDGHFLGFRARLNCENMPSPLRGWCEEISTFAELADLHRNYMGGVERGELNIALLNIVALAHALKVRPSKLIEAVP